VETTLLQSFQTLKLNCFICDIFSSISAIGVIWNEPINISKFCIRQDLLRGADWRVYFSFTFGADHKRHRSQGGVRLSSANIFRTKWAVFRFQMRTSAQFGAKNSNFSKFILCPHEQRGRGSIFRDFVRTSFMNGPLRLFYFFISFLSFIFYVSLLLLF